ncbi:unnamed protein product [Bursaphelenchus xylophilus]|uniref:(pine wood nematode) hypothetical protein n=1 Tax=Bursaphelenchus xylophilus TaxID=6326 RepID=A0A1I7SPX7_BURXY|nr:unnamed protein product [Bursaphelenchus xylophilus]CAG9109338.1 unnamed protein product [Bursaphelenchus xylophilus]
MSYVGANVFVTGASRGIGFGLVQRLIERPDVKRVFAGARTPEKAESLQSLAKSNPKVQIVQFDSLDDKSIKSAVEKVSSVVGDEGLNLLINNAGIFHSDDTVITDPKRDALLLVFNTNVVGVAISQAAFLPLLKKAATADKPARLLNISSGLGSIATLNGATVPHHSCGYAASKSALNALTKQFGTDPASEGVVALAMCPGWVQTDMGGEKAQLTVEESTTAIVDTVSKATKEWSGRYINRNGEDIPY